MYKDRLQLVTFEQAKRLKVLDFDWETSVAYYDDPNAIKSGLAYAVRYGGYVSIKNLLMNVNGMSNLHCSAPTVTLALKWIREEKGIKCCVEFYGNDRYTYVIHTETGTRIFTLKRFFTYESAESALLDELLTILEQEQINNKEYV